MCPVTQCYQQLFEFAQFVADGFGWQLVDPGADSPDGRRNRERILNLIARAAD